MTDTERIATLRAALEKVVKHIDSASMGCDVNFSPEEEYELRAALSATAEPSTESNQGREDRLRRERFQRELAEPDARRAELLRWVGIYGEHCIRAGRSLTASRFYTDDDLTERAQNILKAMPTLAALLEAK